MLGDTGSIDGLLFLVINFAYHLGLALIVGGGLALSLAVAPALYRTLPTRSAAAGAVGEILARWDALAVLSVVAVAIAAFLRALLFESADLRHVARWLALAVMAAATLYASGWAGPVARQVRRQVPAFDDLPEGAPVRREIAALQRAAHRAMALGAVAGIFALFLS